MYVMNRWVDEFNKRFFGLQYSFCLFFCVFTFFFASLSVCLFVYPADSIKIRWSFDLFRKCGWTFDVLSTQKCIARERSQQSNFRHIYFDHRLHVFFRSRFSFFIQTTLIWFAFVLIAMPTIVCTISYFDFDTPNKTK